MISNKNTYNCSLYEDFFNEHKPEDILSSDVIVDGDAASRYIDIVLEWDYNKERMRKVTDFSYS